MESLKDFLQRSDLKNKELMNIMKETALKNETSQTFIETEENKKVEATLKKNGISESLLAKVHLFNLMVNKFLFSGFRLKRKKDYLVRQKIWSHHKKE